MSMPATTEIHNQTPFRLKVQVGNAQYKSDLTTVEAGGKYVISVDLNGTYHEYHVATATAGDSAAKNLVVLSSDDLCDNKSITIKEEAGKLRVHKESRGGHGDQPHGGTAGSSAMASASNRLSRWISSWAPNATSDPR